MDKEAKRDYAHKYYLQKLRYHHPCPVCGQLIIRSAQFCRWHRPYGKGERATGWKGGRFKTGQGYIQIYKPDYHKANKAGYISEHLYIWETTQGKILPEGWIIHHLNGIPADNRPANLLALPAAKHRLILQAKAKRIQELEAMLSKQSQLL